MLLNPYRTAEKLDLAVNSLYNRAFREKIGLTAIKIGHSLRFDSRDVERLIESGRERFSLQPVGRGDNEED